MYLFLPMQEKLWQSHDNKSNVKLTLGAKGRKTVVKPSKNVVGTILIRSLFTMFKL